jgi:hypothetical protein
LFFFSILLSFSFLSLFSFFFCVFCVNYFDIMFFFCDWGFSYEILFVIVWVWWFKYALALICLKENDEIDLIRGKYRLNWSSKIAY